MSSLAILGLFLAGSAIPRPEHPRPEFERSEWLNLNGVWEFAETDDNDARFLGDAKYPDKIVVPFCRESELSGLGRKGFVKNVWYRRTFNAPTDWKSPKMRLHVGASDWKTTVWVNGRRVGEHVGGNAPFAFEIQDALKQGENEVVIHAFDDTRSGVQPLGKQALTEKSEGIFYTRTTGIWQTVWLEGVGSSYLKGFRVEPDTNNKRFRVRGDVLGLNEGVTLKTTIKDGSNVVATAEAPADGRNAQLDLNLANPKWWSVEDPFLYDVELTLVKNGAVIDKVKSYAGYRKVSIEGRAVMLNGKRVFQRLVLDQGFYPDGIWTAPSEEALRKDIELAQAVGFNGARLHQKVFEPRFLYHAAKMGYLCWGEYPNYGFDHKNPAGERPYMEEWGSIVRRDRNNPAIIGWCPFNETPAEAIPLQNSIARLTWELDPDRPLIDTSGWTHGFPEAEIMDAHDYDQNPESFRARYAKRFRAEDLPAHYGDRPIPFMVSEFGGIGWDTGAAGWGYGQAPKTPDEFHVRLKGLVAALTDHEGMFGYVYTQLTDVEQERNGIYRYDRSKKTELDYTKIREAFIQAAAFEKAVAPVPSASWKIVMGNARDGEARWRYSLQEPASGWQTSGTLAQEGLGGFGRKEGWESSVLTPWTTSDIWLTREFDWDGKTFDKGVLAVHFDNATRVWVNGEEVWFSGDKRWNDGYEAVDVSAKLKAALKPGKNRIAAHVHQDSGGQFFDMALLVR